MAIFFLILVVISAVLLILLVMLQDEQGEGLGGIFGGGSGTPFGSRAGNVLTRFTSILAVIFIVSSLALAWFNKSSSEDSVLQTAKQVQIEEGTNGWYVEPGTDTDVDTNSDAMLLDIGTPSSEDETTESNSDEG